MIKSYKYRLYPTKKQEIALQQTLTTCRFLYNNALAERISTYKEKKEHVSYVDQANDLKKNKNDWHKQVHSQVLQNALKRIETSFKNFFRRTKEQKAGKKIKAGFPRFKPDHRFSSFCYPQSGFRITSDNKRIFLSKIGDVKLKYSRATKGTIKTCRVCRDVDRWFVILTCEQETPVISKSLKPAVGVDVGVKTFAFLSDGTSVENPRHLLKSQKKLAKVQRILSKRVLKSKNRNRQRVEVCRVHRSIRNQRDDFLHKLSRTLVENYGSIAFEKLNIRNMVRNHKLAKHISDCSWGKLIEYTTYKAEEAGVEVELVNPRNTTQMCSSCGAIVPKGLEVRIHNCPHCGLREDRDFNASKNILSRAGSARINAFGDLTSTLEHCVLGQVESMN